LVVVVKKRRVNSRTVKEGFGGEWLRDCGPNLGSAVVPEFFRLWGILFDFQLSPDRDNSFVWRWTVDDNFSAKSAYSAFFAGTTTAPIST
jgi:hypothetical protein